MILIVVRAALINAHVLWQYFEELWTHRELGSLLLASLSVVVVCTSFRQLSNIATRSSSYNGSSEHFFLLLRSLPLVRELVKQSKQKVLVDLASGMKQSSLSVERLRALPPSGLSSVAVKMQANLRKKNDYDSPFHASKMTGTVYLTGVEQRELCNSIYCDFAHTNPLHSDAFPSVARMEQEVVSMVGALLNGGTVNDELCGSITSGGTESILTAIRASRDFLRYSKGITEPEMIVSTSAHAAVYKAADYFNIKIKRVPVDEHGRMLIGAVKKELNGKTILIYASAPTYPHGAIDPVADLAKLALANECCLHVDACLGGFFLPFLNKFACDSKHSLFDFQVPGVTSISVDTHKYGFAQKGSSVVLYSSSVLRQFQYTSVSDWSGGLYISPTPAGSRSGGLIAQTWATMLYTGINGYRSAAQSVSEKVMKLRHAIDEIQGLELVGKDVSMIVAWRSSESDVDIYVLNDILSSRGWRLAVLQNPSALHFCVTLANESSIETLISDIKSAVVSSRKLKNVPGGKASVYGLAHGLPDRGVVKELLKDIQDVMLNNA